MFPPNATLGDATLSPNYSTPNNATAILYPDGRTLAQLQPLARCVPNGDVHGYRATEEDLYGAGIYGGHFGSSLSSIGGSIKEGELASADPIRHALQLEIWGRKYLSYDPASPTPGFRWPADRQDGYAENTDGYCSLDPCKSNSNPSMKMGALLALPPTLTAEGLGLTNPAAQKLFYALQNYGGYIVDDTAWDVNQLGVDASVEDDIDFNDPAWARDVNTLFSNLHVIDNNAPTSIGGGGRPLVSPAPRLARPPTADLKPLKRNKWTATVSPNASDAPLALDGRQNNGLADRETVGGKPVSPDRYAAATNVQPAGVGQRSVCVRSRPRL